MRKLSIFSLFAVALILFSTQTLNAQTVYPPEGETWSYGLTYHPPAKDTVYSNYYHAQGYHGSTACIGATCDRVNSVNPGTTSYAKVEDWYVDAMECSYYYHLDTKDGKVLVEKESAEI